MFPHKKYTKIIDFLINYWIIHIPYLKLPNFLQIGQLSSNSLFSNLQNTLFLIISLNSLNFISFVFKRPIIFWIFSSHLLSYSSLGSSNFLHFQQCIAKYIPFNLCKGHFSLSFFIILHPILFIYNYTLRTPILRNSIFLI